MNYQCLLPRRQENCIKSKTLIKQGYENVIRIVLDNNLKVIMLFPKRARSLHIMSISDNNFHPFPSQNNFSTYFNSFWDLEIHPDCIRDKHSFSAE